MTNIRTKVRRNVGPEEPRTNLACALGLIYSEPGRAPEVARRLLLSPTACPPQLARALIEASLRLAGAQTDREEKIGAFLQELKGHFSDAILSPTVASGIAGAYREPSEHVVGAEAHQLLRTEIQRFVDEQAQALETTRVDQKSVHKLDQAFHSLIALARAGLESAARALLEWNNGNTALYLNALIVARPYLQYWGKPANPLMALAFRSRIHGDWLSVPQDEQNSRLTTFRERYAETLLESCPPDQRDFVLQHILNPAFEGTNIDQPVQFAGLDQVRPYVWTAVYANRASWPQSWLSDPNVRMADYAVRCTQGPALHPPSMATQKAVLQELGSQDLPKLLDRSTVEIELHHASACVLTWILSQVPSYRFRASNRFHFQDIGKTLLDPLHDNANADLVIGGRLLARMRGWELLITLAHEWTHRVLRQRAGGLANKSVQEFVTHAAERAIAVQMGWDYESSFRFSTVAGAYAQAHYGVDPAHASDECHEAGAAQVQSLLDAFPFVNASQLFQACLEVDSSATGAYGLGQFVKQVTKKILAQHGLQLHRLPRRISNDRVVELYPAEVLRKAAGLEALIDVRSARS